MNEKEKYLGIILNHIANEISISGDMYDKSVQSYNSVGKWIGEGLRYPVRIMPQGSMNLGTAIKPIDDSDDYDMDLVCLIENGKGLTLKQVKNLVGDRLKDNPIYTEKLEPEGKRCWTMKYDEFHMDILPCIPKEDAFIEPNNTAITLTHKLGDGIYIPKHSNPYAYQKWFEKRMERNLLLEKRVYASANNVQIEKVPTYQVNTPLQNAIKLLKRHRDVLFDGEDEQAPISIIITTLAALSYNGEDDVYSALRAIVEKMPQWIEIRGSTYWVPNPVIREENFAEKWNTEPEKRDSFFRWITKAKKDLLDDPLGCYGIDTISENYKRCIGSAPVNRALGRMGNDTLAARKNKMLYIDNLQEGLTTIPNDKSKAVKEHTFFGK